MLSIENTILLLPLFYNVANKKKKDNNKDPTKQRLIFVSYEMFRRSKMRKILKFNIFINNEKSHLTALFFSWELSLFYWAREKRLSVEKQQNEHDNNNKSASRTG